MKPVILGLYVIVSMAYRAHSAMMGLQPMANPPYIPPPMIPGYGESHGAASAIEWYGPKTYQGSESREFAKEVVLNDDQKEEVSSPDRLTKEVMLDDDQQEEVLSSDPHHDLIKGRKPLCDRRKPVPQSSNMIAPIIEPPMERTEYTKAQMKHLKDRLKYQTNGLDYKYDLEGDNFFQLDKKPCDCSGYCGRMKIFDSKHPHQLVYDTGCCYCSWHSKNPNQVNCGETCLSLAILCPFASLGAWLKAISHSSARNF
ncbi:uncharacterized protein MELLADRAFT_124070 [Melampsora larici-populina 98AG31]|uniref:Secreted protein n=1 Tax=Melampsora larici-populina (strain 98AG31 / pathotype 3-4-7) TaxID=747676 RepID=F4RJV0_MELLP|nr:uncharacterized protein MELLADRAFT_124070 [Melampsora larici-populina 98AG31]EGG07433.1 secreted protein [Melampsora larici-populina 98AG31]